MDSLRVYKKNWFFFSQIASIRMHDDDEISNKNKNREEKKERSITRYEFKSIKDIERIILDSKIFHKQWCVQFPCRYPFDLTLRET